MDNKTTLREIAIANIIIPDDRKETRYDKKEDWDDFKSNIRENGLISAISVKDNTDGTYTLLAGAHRLRACTELGWTTINSTIYSGEIDKTDMVLIELSENIKRKELSPVEESLQKEEFCNLMIKKYGEKRSKSDKKGVSLTDIAKMLGESKSTLSRDLSIARASRYMPELKKVKTKSEAGKIAKNNLDNLTQFKKLKEIKKELKKSSPDNSKKESIKKSLIEMVDRYFKVGDFFEEIKDAANENTDFIHLDPPYGISLDVNKKQKIEDISKMDEYQEIDEEDYLTFIEKTLIECYRVAKRDSFTVLWTGIQWFRDIKEISEGIGYKVADVPAVWIKGKGQTNNPRFLLATETEFFMILRKGTPEIKKKGRTNLFNFKPLPPEKKIHPTAKPIELILEIYKTFAWKGSRILSPYLGSGIDIIAAIEFDSICYGYDLSQEYKNAFLVQVSERFKKERS